MGFGKHAPARLNHLLGSQTDQIEQLRKLGFVQAPELSLELFADGSAAHLGVIRCQGGLYLQVYQLIVQESRIGGHSLFCVEAYSYSAVALGVGTIFRYDSPHDDHNTEHHVHEFGEAGNRESAVVRFLYSEDEIPTLADALWRLYYWHLANLPATPDEAGR